MNTRREFIGRLLGGAAVTVAPQELAPTYTVGLEEVWKETPAQEWFEDYIVSSITIKGRLVTSIECEKP